MLCIHHMRKFANLALEEIVLTLKSATEQTTNVFLWWRENKMGRLNIFNMLFMFCLKYKD